MRSPRDLRHRFYISSGTRSVEVLVERCCGLDVHQKTVVACVLIASGVERPHKEIRTYRTMTDDLLALADCLVFLGAVAASTESIPRCATSPVGCRTDLRLAVSEPSFQSRL